MTWLMCPCADSILFTLLFLPTFFPPIHVTLRHPEALDNGFSSISLLIRISTAFSFSNSLNLYSLLPLFFPCTTHLFITSWVIIPHLHFEMQRRPHHLFVSSILEDAIHARFSF
ncbi:hypothetical protein F5888DRAFT_363239 [Russula emetica]|nr:hypothetical protein F5888DRAFT_363239 [Russula emetica]